jgi:serine/threonine protein kinase
MGALLSSCRGKSRNLAVVEGSNAPTVTRMPSAPLIRQRSFHEGLVRVRQPTDSVEDFYVILDCIGRGSFSKVFLIKKKEEQIGGTSRPGNVKKKIGGDSDDDILSDSIRSETELNGSRRTRSVVVKKDLFFVLKEINLTQVSHKQIDQLLNEVSLLTAIDHKNVIKIYETFSRNSLETAQPPQCLQIVMEYCSGGDLSTRFPYTEHRVAQIIRQIVSAVRYVVEKLIDCPLFAYASVRLSHI